MRAADVSRSRPQSAVKDGHLCITCQIALREAHDLRIRVSSGSRKCGEPSKCCAEHGMADKTMSGCEHVSLLCRRALDLCRSCFFSSKRAVRFAWSPELQLSSQPFTQT